MQPSRHKNQGIYLHNPFIVMNGIFHLRRLLATSSSAAAMAVKVQKAKENLKIA